MTKIVVALVAVLFAGWVWVAGFEARVIAFLFWPFGLVILLLLGKLTFVDRKPKKGDETAVLDLGELDDL